MKAAIITLNTHNNYGNRLQNYALQVFLSKYMDVVDTIWHEKNNYLPEMESRHLKVTIKSIWDKNRIKNFGIDCIREYNIKKFSDKYISIKYDYDINKDLNNKYDYFFVGSDQVWNPFIWKWCKNDTVMFLDFVSPKKRIAFSASFGIEKLPTNKIDLFKKYLSQMKSISVRESRGSDIIYNLLGKHVPVIVDPTMLINSEHWKKIAQRPAWYNDEKYILTYFLGKDNEGKMLKEITKKISNKYNLKIFNLMDKANIELNTSKVEEFIYLIEHASLVCSNSFHGTVFSILMNTPFYVVNFKPNAMENRGSRIETLLNLFNLKDRYLGEDALYEELNNIFDVDFSHVENILFKERIIAEKFLKKAINL